MDFLHETLIFLLVALVSVGIGRRLGSSPVLGYLAGGLAIGPHGFGLVGDAAPVLRFAEIGVVFLLFVIGLELQPRRLWVMRRLVFGLGTAQLVTAALALAAVLHWGLSFAPTPALLVGYALALSSTAFVLQLLGEQRKLTSAHGRAAFGVLLLQDLAVIPVLALVNLVSARSGEETPDAWALPAVFAGLVAARFLLRPLLRVVAGTGARELFSAATLALVVGAALAMHAAGLSMALGAFLAGMMVADSEYRHQLEADIEPFKGLLLGLFFMAVGMSVDVRLLLSEPLLLGALAAGLMVLKALLLAPVARAFGLGRSDATRLAVVTSQGGEFAFVLLAAGVAAGLLAGGAADRAVLVVILSMALTPLAAGLAERVLAETAPRRPFDRIESDTRTVIIAGFGRFGQIVGRLLAMHGIPFTALEINPGQVDFVRSFGNEIFYGDASRLDLLHAAGLNGARAVVVAVDDMDTAVRMVEVVRESAPGVKILARARNRQHEIRLKEVGAHTVVRELLHSSVDLARALLVALGRDEETARASVELFRAHDAATLERQRAVTDDPAAFRQTTRDAAAELRQLFEDDARSRVSPSTTPPRDD
jgi:monovalent cation:proton antiporter-2 (CPA2) family protein